jgi:caffeoyl-CoA O-methyltransferase
MSSIVPEAVEEYARQHTTEEPPLLQELAKDTYKKMPLPQRQIGHVAGTFLRFLVEMLQARRVLELGTFTGYSALAMAEGLPKDGRLITCDIDGESTAMARRFWARSPHGSKIELHLGPALETLPTLEGPFDLVFIDADKENYVAYWEGCVPLVRSGGLLVADNVLRGGRVLDPQSDSDRAIAAFNDRVRRDSRVEAVMLTVRDGLTLARKL